MISGKTATSIALTALLLFAPPIFFSCIDIYGDQKATIVVNPTHELGKVNRLIFGNNQIGYQFGMDQWATTQYSNQGSGVWDPAAGKPVPAMVELARDINMTVARWPGGCSTHNFNWKTKIGPVAQRPVQQFGLPEFLSFCAATRAVPLITVAEYFGSAQDAADLVEYLNAPDDGLHPWAAKRTADGRKEPWNVVWFEYGNESDHGNHGGGTGFPAFPFPYKKFSPQEYAGLYLQYRTAMKQVDKNIKLGAVMVPGVQPYVLPVWDTAVLKAIGPNLDFVIPHTYVPFYDAGKDNLPADKLFSIGLAGPNQIPLYFRQLLDAIRQYTGRTDVMLANTEFNGNFIGDKPVSYRFCLGNALIVADMLKVFLQPENKTMLASYWQFANEYWGMVKGYGEPYVRRPAYWVFWLYARHFGDVLVESKVDCAGYETSGGLTVMPASGKPVDFQLFPADLLPEQKWNIWQVAGAVTAQADGILTVDIQTDADLNYYHAQKSMPVQPSTTYRLTAEIRFEGPATAQGGYVQIGDARGWDATHSSAWTETVKYPDWVLVTADYTTLTDTKSLSIQARRLGGAGSKCKICIRNVRVQKIIPANVGAVPYLSVNASKSSDGKKIYLMIVNKNLTEAIPASIKVPGAQTAAAWCLNGPSIDAVNEKNPDNVRVAELAMSTHAVWLDITLPAHSMTAVEVGLQ